jgi:hypothetical protein
MFAGGRFPLGLDVGHCASEYSMRRTGGVAGRSHQLCTGGMIPLYEVDPQNQGPSRAGGDFEGSTSGIKDLSKHSWRGHGPQALEAVRFPGGGNYEKMRELPAAKIAARTPP